MEPNRERLKLILKNLKSLVDALESEIYSDPDRYKSSIDTRGTPSYLDCAYEEVFKNALTYSDVSDDDGYAD